ncbi:MAG: response regulator [Candidatus Scalindua sp.]|nr:response regulator [Candidatus Scalindua sp.]
MQQKINILVIDDAPGMRMALAGLLEYAGYHVVVAEDGYHGINAARKLNFNVAFIDVRMPGIDGWKTSREVKKINPDTNVIMMTGLDSDQCSDKVVSQGPFACISKPFDGAELLQLVDRAIGKEGKEK